MVIDALLRHLDVETRSDTPFMQHPSTFLDKHFLRSMGYIKNPYNNWVKKTEHATIDPDEVALGDDEVNIDDVDRDGHEDDATAGVLSSASFDTQRAFETILGRFDNLSTRWSRSKMRSLHKFRRCRSFSMSSIIVSDASIHHRPHRDFPCCHVFLGFTHVFLL